jgi:hypothetical protein
MDQGQSTHNLHPQECLHCYLDLKSASSRNPAGRDSSGGIATSYDLDGRGVQSRRGSDFPHPSRSALGPPRLPYSGYLVTFPGVKLLGLDVDHPTRTNAEVKERVEVYLYNHIL